MSTIKSELISKKHDFISDDSGNFTATDGDGSHVTASPRIHPTDSVQSTRLTEDGCYTSEISISDYLTAPSTPRNPESYLKTIFDNFNELYQDKMAWIDENISGGDNHAQAKKNVLEHWVKDVIEQNNILVQTVEELELEAEKKVQNLQKRVQEASEIAKQHMTMIKDYEEQIKQLMKEKHIVDKQEEFFRKESMYLEKEKRRALDRLHTLENDNTSLVTLINRIRDMGVWDINGLNFSPRTYDCIFGLYPSLAGSEVQTVFTREKARNLEKAESNVAQLMTQLDELHGRKTEAERLLTEKTKVTEDLQNDIKDLNTKIKQYQDEHQEIKRSLKETQDQLKAANLKNVSRPSTADTKRDSEMKEMLSELRDLRNQLNIACSERQQAMKESNSLKMELRGRIAQMEDMKCLLDQIQTEAATTRVAVQDVQDKQDQMTSLKEKVTFYQESYENSNLLLEAKSEIIVKLQDQMEQLHDKVTKLEKSRSCSPKTAQLPNPSPPPLATTVSPSPTPSHHHSHPSRPSSHLIQVQSKGALSCKTKQKIKDAIRRAAIKVKKASTTPRSSRGEQKNYDSKRLYSSQKHHHKPPWNDHFVRKPLSPRATTSENKIRTQVSKYSETKAVETPKVAYVVKSDLSARNEKVDEKRTVTESLKVGATTNPYKFPPISTKCDATPGTKNLISLPQSTAKAFEKAIEEHLPRIIVKEKKIHTASGIETLENLMEVCVKASRELNRQADMEGKSAPKYRVCTGHSHRRHSHRSRENTYTVEAVPKSRPVKLDAGVSKPVVCVAKPEIKFYMGKSKVEENPRTNGSGSDTMSDISQFRRVALHPPISHSSSFRGEKSPESILADLPKESQDYLVKKWIISSPSPSRNILTPRSDSPSKSTTQNASSEISRPDSKEKSKGRLANILNEWNRRHEMTQSDGTGDRDSGHMSDDFSDWNWNVNEDEILDKDIQSNHSADNLVPSVMENHLRVLNDGLNHHNHGYDFAQLITENQRLQDEKYELQQMNSVLKRDKLKSDSAHKKEMELKDIEDCSSPFNNDDYINHLTVTQRALSSYRDKVGSFSREINATTKPRCDKLRSQSINLEKDILMYRSYALLSQLEHDKELLMIGGDCNPSLDCNDVRIVELKQSWEKQTQKITQGTIALMAEVEAKAELLNNLKHEGEKMHVEIKELVGQATIFQEIMSAAKAENSKLHSKIKELENTQQDVQEMLLMESEFKKMNNEAESCDTGLLIAEKRLGMIQKSYEYLAHQVLNREEAIEQRDLQIEKLQNYIRDKEFNYSLDSSSSFQSNETLDHFMAGDSQMNTSVNSIERERVQKLIWLVTALRKKLKKRKDLDRKFKLDKEILIKTVSTMSYTWEELRKCCENLRNENLYLKHQLETLSICPSPSSCSPCQITSRLDHEEVSEASERRILLNSSSTVTTPIPKPTANYPVVEKKDNNFITGHPDFPQEIHTSTPKGIDLMSRVLLVLEECVNNVTHLLHPQDPHG